MENGSELLMLSGVRALCADCGGERIFVPVERVGDPGDLGRDAGEFCCTSCDAAVFMLEVLENPENTGAPHRNVA